MYSLSGRSICVGNAFSGVFMRSCNIYQFFRLKDLLGECIQALMKRSIVSGIYNRNYSAILATNLQGSENGRVVTIVEYNDWIIPVKSSSSFGIHSGPESVSVYQKMSGGDNQ